MKGEKFDNPPIMFAVTESELQRFRKTETENTLLKEQTECLEKENKQLKIEAAKLRTVKDNYKKLLKDIYDIMREPIDIGDYLIDEFGGVFADWDSCVKEDWELVE